MNIFNVLTITSLALNLSCKARVDSGLSEKADMKVNTDSVQIVMQDILERSGGMNPYNSKSSAIQSLAKFIYEPLAVYRTADPLTEEPTPLLAEKIDFDETAKSLTIKLRKGIMFHNLTGGFKLSESAKDDKGYALGNVSRAKADPHASYELTSDDVEFSLLMAAHLKNHTANTWLQGSNLRVQKIDSHTLKVFWNPNENFTAAKNSNYIFAYKILSTLILPKRGMDYEYYFDWSSPSTKNFEDALKKSFIEKTMWGTGPYKFSSRRPGFYAYGAGSQNGPSGAPSIFLDKNYEYWGKDLQDLNLAAGLPFASIEIVGNMTTAQDDLISKGQDTVGIAYMSGTRGKSYIKRSGNDGIVSLPLPSSSTYYLMLSFAKPMGDFEVNICTLQSFRKALSLSLDRTKLANSFADFTEPATSFFGEGPYTDSTPIEFNPSSAKSAFVSVGAMDANGNIKTPHYVLGSYRNFTINYPKFDDAGREIAYGLRQQLSDLGFRVGIPDFASSLASEFQSNWRGDWIIRKVKDEGIPDPRVFWHSKGPGNDMGYANSKVDQIIDRIHSELDASRFYNHYHQLDALLKNELPAIPLVRVKNFAALSSKMQLVASQNDGVLETLIGVLGW